jgi:murein L,D-transpeptidase YcbB/YkuD
MIQRSTSLLLLLFLALAPAAAAQGGAGAIRVDLNIPSSRLVVYEGEKVIATYPTSVGVRGHNTPLGEFKIDHAEWNPWWRPPEREWAKNEKVTPPGPNNPMGRVKLFFAPLYFIHGTPAAASIGTPASHGCVRLLNKDAVALATLLHERARATAAASDIPKILASGQTRRSDFRAPASLTIRYDLVEVDSAEVRIYPDVYRYNTAHSEAVIQALIRAGYDPSTIERAKVRELLARPRPAKGTLRVPLREAFGTGLALAGAR